MQRQTPRVRRHPQAHALLLLDPGLQRLLLLSSFMLRTHVYGKVRPPFDLAVLRALYTRPPVVTSATSATITTTTTTTTSTTTIINITIIIPFYSPQKHDQGSPRQRRSRRVVALDTVLVAAAEELLADDAPHMLIVEQREFPLVHDQGVQVVQRDEARRGGGGGSLQERRVGAQERVPVQRAAGKVVDDFSAEAPGEHGVVVRESRELRQQGGGPGHMAVMVVTMSGGRGRISKIWWDNGKCTEKQNKRGTGTGLI
ncbi:hypothetical protein AAL_07533 [Moelleriella libera RCEF 2490]|uniref:Uncharacterized protein n=1 Tax=Moelleriella libera RCEF 2490 TaxID=1081109 RepID=A0A166NFA8_9HYPO|nr:hypothetical protein AAL_07533 [Moelleriella libera RCEF 2490]